MYAVVSSGGKQYRVEAGSTLIVDRLAGDAGSTVVFDRVLLVGDGESVTIGTPTIAGASVTATVLGEHLGEKIVVFKFKPKAKYRRRTGHRQHLTRVRVDAITADGRTVRAEAPKAAAKPKASVDEPEAPKARARRAKTDEAAAPSTVAERAEATPEAADAAKPATRRRTPKAASAAGSSASDQTETKSGAAESGTQPARARRTRKPKDTTSEE